MSYVITALVDNVPELVAQASSADEAFELLDRTHSKTMAHVDDLRIIGDAFYVALNQYRTTPMNQRLRPVPFVLNGDRKFWVVVS